MMEKRLMIRMLDDRIDEYHRNHPATAEMDAIIFCAYCAGKSASCISAEIPCSESTVYRAIRRVKKFLLQSEEPSWLDTLHKQIAEINYGDWDAQGLLEMLYVAYTDHNRIDIGCDKSGFVTLQHQLADIPEQSVDSVFDTVCDLCLSHERAGFTAGIKVGIQLGNELGI